MPDEHRPSNRPMPSPAVSPTVITDAPVATPGTPAPSTGSSDVSNRPSPGIPYATTIPTPVHVATSNPVAVTVHPSKSPVLLKPSHMPIPSATQPTEHPVAPFAPPVAIPVTAWPSKHLSASLAPSTFVVPSLKPVALTTLTPSIRDPSQPVVDTDESVFTCAEGGVTYAIPPFQPEAVDISVGYEIESSLPFEAFREPMEKLILDSILVGALECGRLDVEGNVSMDTRLTGDSCLSQVDPLNDCVVALTSATLLLAGELIDPPIARFLAYVELQGDMETYHERLEGVARVAYSSPELLTVPEISEPDVSDEQGSLQADNERLSTSPWTIGSALVICKYRLTCLCFLSCFLTVELRVRYRWNHFPLGLGAQSSRT
ncbi:hypothetical protein FisN_19Lh106 [Fistulifera solaris]|uniref:Uncharacterized protein n=1 Tax=Fistulifera solaris TaxID=1519565 RepID=A0A1Z5J6W4_FISSO|nr:hypothetical protein FisN_19Lh106 [Fistulifera solaris]|eukprot:GAX09642.1 hypothetical protein FisN_19Lh106 [Fistulifera solaris]